MNYNLINAINSAFAYLHVANILGTSPRAIERIATQDYDIRTVGGDFRSHVAELCDLIGVLPEDVFDHEACRTTSLQSLPPDNDTLFETTFRYEKCRKVRAIVDDTIAQMATKRVKIEVYQRYKAIIYMRFGLEPYDQEYTLEEIADLFGVTRECIRALESRIIRELRSPAATRKFKPFLEPPTTHDRKPPTLPHCSPEATNARYEHMAKYGFPFDHLNNSCEFYKSSNGAEIKFYRSSGSWGYDEDPNQPLRQKANGRLWDRWGSFESSMFRFVVKQAKIKAEIEIKNAPINARYEHMAKHGFSLNYVDSVNQRESYKSSTGALFVFSRTNAAWAYKDPPNRDGWDSTGTTEDSMREFVASLNA